jgi:hypothetical protein
VLISGDRFPTPAEIEARERAAQAAAPAQPPAVDSVRDSRVVRIWVPAGH